MSFAAVDKEATHRLREVDSFLKLVQSNSGDGSPQALRDDIRSSKGLFFVHLYGAFEFTVTYTVQTAIEALNLAGHRVKDLTSSLQCLALDSKFQSIESGSGKRLWERRWELLHADTMATTIAIKDSLMPVDLGNLKPKHLSMLARAFGITGDLLPSPAVSGIIVELADNRMAVAHGRESAATIGQRYTFSILHDRLRVIRDVCDHVVHTFDDHFASAQYLSVSGKRARTVARRSAAT